MANLFVADQIRLKQEGDKLILGAFEFDKNTEKVYSTIHALISSGYVSEAARAIGMDIDKYHDDLEDMANTIRNFGKYLIHAGDTVAKNEQNIIDNTTK